MRTPPPLLLAAVLAVAAPAAGRAQVPYTFTTVALSGTGSPFAGVFPPSLNGSGVAAFGATLNAGGAGVFIGSGGTIQTIAQTGPNFSAFNFPPGPIVASISPASNSTAFYAVRTPANGGGIGIFSGNGGPQTPIAVTSGTSPFVNFGPAPGINPGGTVAFHGIGTAGQGIFHGTGGALTTIAQTGPVFSNFNDAVSINGFNAVSFGAGLTAGGSGIFRGTGPSAITPIALTGTTFLGFRGPTDVNGSGRVAFVADLAAGGSGVFTGDGGAIATIAATGAAFTSFDPFVSINSAGGVTFAATLLAGGKGIFTGSDPVANRVIRTGDVLDGSTVFTLGYAAGAVTDMGQIAFAAQLANGRQGIYIATPVPEPAGVLFLAGAGLAACGWWRRCAAQTGARRLA